MSPTSPWACSSLTHLRITSPTTSPVSRRTTARCRTSPSERMARPAIFCSRVARTSGSVWGPQYRYRATSGRERMPNRASKSSATYGRSSSRSVSNGPAGSNPLNASSLAGCRAEDTAPLEPSFDTGRAANTGRGRRSGQHQEEALELLGVVALVAGRGLVGEALAELAGQEPEPDPVHRPAHRRELLDDVLAVPALLEHPDDPAELALHAAQPVQRLRNDLAVELHPSPPHPCRSGAIVACRTPQGIWVLRPRESGPLAPSTGSRAVPRWPHEEGGQHGRHAFPGPVLGDRRQAHGRGGARGGRGGHGPQGQRPAPVLGPRRVPRRPNPQGPRRGSRSGTGGRRGHGPGGRAGPAALGRPARAGQAGRRGRHPRLLALHGAARDLERRAGPTGRRRRGRGGLHGRRHRPHRRLLTPRGG